MARFFLERPWGWEQGEGVIGREHGLQDRADQNAPGTGAGSRSEIPRLPSTGSGRAAALARDDGLGVSSRIIGRGV